MNLRDATLAGRFCCSSRAGNSIGTDSIALFTYHWNMGTCIYCSAKADSVEHPLPRALGNFKGYAPLLDRVCSACNGKLGLLDEQLCRSGIEAFFRAHLESDGRKQHAKANVFYRGSAGGRRLEMVGVNQATGKDVLLELVGGNEARELRCATLVAEDDTVHVITITDGMTPEQFKKRVTDLGVKRSKTADFSAGSEEIEWVESLMNGLTSEGRTEWTHSTVGPIVYGPARIKFTVTSRYFRCMGKIGFRYFLTKMPQFRGDESCFDDLREFIINEGDVDKCKNFVTFNQQPLAWQLRQGQRLSAWGHILCAETDCMQFRAKVQLFAGPEAQPNVYTIHLGRNPSRIDFTEAYGDFLAYYPKEERGEFDGEVSELIGTQRLR
jgi:hypothetical protein